MLSATKNWMHYLKGIVLSYSQIYFSNSTGLGIALMVISFFDLGIGISGIIAIVVCQLTSLFFNFNKIYIFDGAYTYNALLLGLAMGSFYKMSFPFLFVLVIAAMLTFFLTVYISGRLGKMGLPFLSLPFLIAVWVLILGLSNFSGIKLTTKSTFSLEVNLPQIFTNVNQFVDLWLFKDFMHVYLRSLSALIFQYNDLAGLLIAVCLLLHSRITFALSFYGFCIGYLFYYHFEGDFTPLIYSYIGFNFILVAIALGGFYIVPSFKSHFLLFFVIPVTALLISALHTLFYKFHLPLYSFPFSMVVLLVIGVLQMRLSSSGLELVTNQQYKPEDNHYKTLYLKKRFAGQTFFHIFLPIFGEWHIPQGHNGKITHKDIWKHAWDFDIQDEFGKTFQEPGTSVKDYFCYDLPVIAPSSGYITTIKDGVEDNLISDINLDQNWGNTVVIKHADGLYSKLSHLKPGSIKVKEGEWVNIGDILGTCGSSGRSPEPHLHFQLQSTPYIGSKTLNYPIAYYLVNENNNYTFHSFSIPKEGQVVRNVLACNILTNAFGFIPGEDMIWDITEKEKTKQQKWSFYVDIFNKKYIYCHTTKSSAYFVNDGTLFYFTDFYGNKKSFLYQFYISFHKIILGCYHGITLSDWLMPQVFFNPFIRIIQDFIAPFYHFIEGKFHFEFEKVDNYLNPERIVIKTISKGILFGKDIQQIVGTLSINLIGMGEITIISNKRKITATCKK